MELTHYLTSANNEHTHIHTQACDCLNSPTLLIYLMLKQVSTNLWSHVISKSAWIFLLEFKTTHSSIHAVQLSPAVHSTQQKALFHNLLMANTFL